MDGKSNLNKNCLDCEYCCGKRTASYDPNGMLDHIPSLVCLLKPELGDLTYEVFFGDRPDGCPLEAETRCD